MLALTCLLSPQDNLLLDMYLAPHVRTLYTQIRNRALIQVSVGTPGPGRAPQPHLEAAGN